MSTKIGDQQAAAAFRSKQEIVIPVGEQKRIANDARNIATNLIAEIERKCREVIKAEAALPEYDPARVARNLGAVFDGYLDYGESFAARRPMKVRDKERYRQWQETRMPFLKYIKTTLFKEVVVTLERQAGDKRLTAEQRADAKLRLNALGKSRDRLSPQQKKTLAKTRWRETYYRNQVDKALANNEITHIRYTLGVAKEHTEICMVRDGWVAKKDDPEIQRNRPPNHYGCRSKLQFLTGAMMEAYGLSEYRPPRIEDVPPAMGFGG